MYDFQIPAAVIRGLARDGRVRTSVRSPLHAYATADGAVAAQPLDDDQLAAITLLANPTALVRVRAVAPADAEPAAFAQFIRDEQVAGFAYDGDVLHLGLRRPLADLAADLAVAAAHTGPLTGQHYQLWPSVIETLSTLWGAAGSGLALGPADLAGAFPDHSLDERRAILDRAAERGAVVVDGDAYAIRPPIRPWLDLLWSGHALQLEHLRLRFGVPLDETLATTGDILRFVGAEGLRVRVQHITGDELAAITAGAPPEPALIRLSAPAPAKLEATIRRLLRLRDPRHPQ